jgi:anti-anti-sigma factor
MTAIGDARDVRIIADLRVEIYRAGPATVIELSGEFDAYAAHNLRRYLATYTPDRFAHVVIDLRALAFIDSSGISVVVALGKQAERQAGALRLVLSGNHMLTKLQRMGLLSLWPVHSDLDDALLAAVPVRHARRGTGEYAVG